MANLGREDVKKFFSTIRYTDEQVEQYTSDIIDWFDRSWILDEDRKEAIVKYLPVIISAFELGLFAHRTEIMAMRKIANGLPA